MPLGYEVEEWRRMQDRDGRDEATGPVIHTARGVPPAPKPAIKAAPGIYEFLIVDDVIRPLILQRADASTLRQQAIGQGMKTMAADGWNKVAQGVTTVEEVLRVTQE